MKTLWIIVAALAIGAGAPAKAQSFKNVFDYCAAIGTIDQADSRFSGIFPESKAAILFRIEPGALHVNTFVWRCMNRAVWVCAQLNSAICGKADVSREPTKPMVDHCQMDPDTAVIPAVVTGHEHPPIYDWACRQGVPTVTRQIFTPDARGYPPDLWKQLTQ